MAKTKRVPVPPEADPRVSLCLRLKIDPARLADPEFKAKVDNYFREVRAIIDQHCHCPDPEIRNSGQAVQGCRVANRLSTKRVFYEGH